MSVFICDKHVYLHEFVGFLVLSLFWRTNVFHDLVQLFVFMKVFFIDLR